MQAEIDLEDIPKIFVLSALDRLLQHHRNHPETTSALLEQKQNMLGLIEQGKITPKKYKMLVGNALKSELATVKECATKDTSMLANPKDKEEVERWFRKAVETSKSLMGAQQNLNKTRHEAVSRIKQSRLGASSIDGNNIPSPKKREPEVKPPQPPAIKKPE